MEENNLGNSIFRFEQKAGVNSKMGNWSRTSQNMSSIPEEGAGSRYDFLPVVKINDAEQPANAIVISKSCTQHTLGKINLGADYDVNKREYWVSEIVIPQSSTARIPLLIKRGYDPDGLQDEDGELSFVCSNANIQLKFIDNDDTGYDDDEDQYDLKDAAYGDELVMEISINRDKNTRKSLVARGEIFTITVYASDDDDGWGKTSSRKGICGQFKVKVIEHDVFTKDEVDKLIAEINMISNYCSIKDESKRPKEYQREYCMHAADRALGKMLDNKSVFYTYDDNSQKIINFPKPRFTNAPERAVDLKQFGYVLTIYKYNKYSFSEKKVTDEYGNNPTRTVFIKNENSILPYFEESLKNKIGLSVYYLSTVNGFHTLLLVIDNTNPCNPTYTIYDDFGVAESGGKGKLGDIDNGFAGQSTWLYRWVKGSPRFGYWSDLTTTVAKVKRK